MATVPTEALRRSHRWVPAGLLGAVPVALTALTILLTFRTGFTASVFTLLPSTAAIGVVGALLAWLRPRYAGGWLMLATGTAFLIGQVAEQVAVSAESDTVTANATWVETWIYPPALVPLFVLVPLTFPDGKLPSPRWRPLVVVAAVLMVGLALAPAFLTPTLAPLDGRVLPNPYAIGSGSTLGILPDVLALATLAATIVAMTSLVVRWRAADRVVRQQILWVVLALAVMSVTFAADAAVAHLSPAVYGTVFPVIQLMPIVLPVAVAIAVLRHQLFDIELLVGRTLIYLVLTGALVAAYVATVAVAGAALPGSQESIAQVAAVAVVAVAFAPLRDWLQRRAQRLLFGDRAQPYAALARISRQLSTRSTPDELLTTLAAAVAASLRSPYVSLALATDGAHGPAVEHGTRPPPEAQLLNVDLRHGGQPVGTLVVAQRGREPYTSADLRLLETLTLPVGTALHALRLSEQVRHSRELLVRSVEEERRRLGRDLHDSLGPRLAAIGMQVEAAADVLRTDPDRAVGLLTAVLDQTDHALREARGLAHAHRPPTLDTLGLVPALQALLSQLTAVPATLVAPQPLPALPAAVETAAYRITTEAVHNVAKHSVARTCLVRIEYDGTQLRVDVQDDGRGMTQPHVPGVGLASMRERAEELGGALTVTPAANGAGTRVQAVLPCAAWTARQSVEVEERR